MSQKSIHNIYNIIVFRHIYIYIRYEYMCYINSNSYINFILYLSIKFLVLCYWDIAIQNIAQAIAQAKGITFLPQLKSKNLSMLNLYFPSNLTLSINCYVLDEEIAIHRLRQWYACVISFSLCVYDSVLMLFNVGNASPLLPLCSQWCSPLNVWTSLQNTFGHYFVYLLIIKVSFPWKG